MSRPFDDSADRIRTSRRRFVQYLGAAAAATPLAGLLPAAAQTAAPTTPPPTAPPTTTSDSDDPAMAADAQSITDMIQRRFGARLDAAQLQSIRDDVESNLGAGRVLRGLELGNADEPDIIFRARSPGGVRMLTPDILMLSARELGRRIRGGDFTSVELTTSMLQRLRTVGARLNAVVTLCEERALAEARAADRELARGRARGPLHGVPYGVKDLLATRGAPTSWGAEPYRDQTLDFDATVVQRLQAAGCVLIAKLAMVELAGGMGYDEADASFTGPGITPWNLAYWSGGSSSGPGAAVAAGCVGFAIGSETSGSILTPAAFCGVSGLRPTYGLVSRHGAMALCWTLDKLGPMCRSADDCALVLEAIAGHDAADETSVERDFRWTPQARLAGQRLRIAVPKGCVEDVQPAVRANFEASLAALGDAVTVTRDVAWPEFPWGPAVGTIVNAEGAAAFLPMLESGDAARLRCPADRIGGYAAMYTFAVDYIQALRVRAPMKRAVNDLLRDYDVIASPTRASVSYPLDRKFRDAYPGVRGGPPLIPAGNLCGLPAVCVPNGFGDHDLPTSIAFMGAAFAELELLQLADTLQQATDWHRRVPPVG